MNNSRRIVRERLEFQKELQQASGVQRAEIAAVTKRVMVLLTDEFAALLALLENSGTSQQVLRDARERLLAMLVQLNERLRALTTPPRPKQ